MLKLIKNLFKGKKQPDVSHSASKNEDWSESEFAEIKPETIAELKAIVGNLNGWLQTDDFMRKEY